MTSLTGNELMKQSPVRVLSFLILAAMWVGAPGMQAAEDQHYDLVGQLRIRTDVDGVATASIVNAVSTGLFDGSIQVDVSEVGPALRKRLIEAEARWVGLDGSWEQRPEEDVMVFRPSAVTVLDQGFHLTGRIVAYDHPDGSMAHVTHALVTNSGRVVPLATGPGRPDLARLEPGFRYKIYGSFQPDGHKGLLRSYAVARIETIPEQEDEHGERP